MKPRSFGLAESSGRELRIRGNLRHPVWAAKLLRDMRHVMLSRLFALLQYICVLYLYMEIDDAIDFFLGHSLQPPLSQFSDFYLDFDHCTAAAISERICCAARAVTYHYISDTVLTHSDFISTTRLFVLCPSSVSQPGFQGFFY